MSSQDLYKAVLMDHFRRPRNRGDLADADVVCRGSNPRCGDDLEVGLYLEAGRVGQVRFRGRGCALCIASASMMTEAASGKNIGEVRRLCDLVQAWLAQGKGGEGQLQAPPSELEALSSVHAHPARRRCVLLSWEALSDAIGAL